MTARGGQLLYQHSLDDLDAASTHPMIVPTTADVPSSGSLSKATMNVGNLATMTGLDASAIPSNPGFTPAPLLPPLPGYTATGNDWIRLGQIETFPIPDRPAAPIGTGTPPVKLDLGPEAFPIVDPIDAMILASKATSGLIHVPENSGKPTSAAQKAGQDYEAQTPGTTTDPVTGQKLVPALIYQNPNPKGSSYVKWDGSQVLPDKTTELIDSKTSIVRFDNKAGFTVPDNVADELKRQQAALVQNPGYKGVIEVPTELAASRAKEVLDYLEIGNIDVRVRPFKN